MPSVGNRKKKYGSQRSMSGEHEFEGSEWALICTHPQTYSIFSPGICTPAIDRKRVREEAEVRTKVLQERAAKRQKREQAQKEAADAKKKEEEEVCDLTGWGHEMSRSRGVSTGLVVQGT